jgi:hypothetical protein
MSKPPPKDPRGAAEHALLQRHVDGLLGALKATSQRTALPHCGLLLATIATATRVLADELGHPECASSMVMSLFEQLAARYPAVVKAQVREAMAGRIVEDAASALVIILSEGGPAAYAQGAQSPPGAAGDDDVPPPGRRH